MMKKIAVVDDDIYIGDMLSEVLTRAGYGVMRAYSGTEAVMLFSRETPDLVLLDLMLPGLSGEQVIEKLHGAPVIVVSAKVSTQDKVKLLNSGAVDYVTKPFDIDELLARIAVRLRDARDPLGEGLTCGKVRLDTASHFVTVSGNEVRLTKTEFAILKLLMQSKGRAVARSVILDRISLDTPDCVEGSLKVHISNLRRKLRDAGAEDAIESVWGIGFIMNE